MAVDREERSTDRQLATFDVDSLDHAAQRNFAEDFAQLFAALGHPLRVQAVAYLAGRPGGGAYVSDVVAALRRAQSTVSHHLKVLVDAGVVTAEARGTWIWYSLAWPRLADLSERLLELGGSSPQIAGGAAT